MSFLLSTEPLAMATSTFSKPVQKNPDTKYEPPKHTQPGKLAKTSKNSLLTWLKRDSKLIWNPSMCRFLHWSNCSKELTQDKLARTAPTAGSCNYCFPSECPLSDGPGIWKILPLTSLVTANYPPDIVTGASRTSHRRPPAPPLPGDVVNDDKTLFSKRNRKIDYSQTSHTAEQYEDIIDATIIGPTHLQALSAYHKLLHTQVPRLKGKKRSLRWIWTSLPQPRTTA